MAPSLYLINPAADFPTYFGAEVVAGSGLAPATTIADLATTTVAAFAPGDFEVAICDENVTPVDLGCEASYVALTGKVSQQRRMFALADEFRRRGSTVILGGPMVSLSPDRARRHGDVLVRGEIEEIAPRLFADLRRGRPAEEYVGTRPPLELTPLPRWDLYPNDRALLGTVQTSRGCPFECDFCDAIQYLGRRQRHKPIDRVLAELDELYRRGYRQVFLADDNFTSSRQRAKELLAALAHWNRRRADGHVLFSTQVSLDAGRDDELLEMCAAAGLVYVFVGIETPNSESLQGSKKRQNLGEDPTVRVQRFHDHGILVVSGMIVGFDEDGLDIFARQLELATAAALPVVTLGSLVAPEATPLHARMRREGRLVEGGEETAATPWDTNIVPLRMTREELLAGSRWLANRLYEPDAFGRRILELFDRLGERRDPKHLSGERQPWRARRSVERDARRLVRRVGTLGWRELRMAGRLFTAALRRPERLDFLGPILLHYAQLRYMYRLGGLWGDPATANGRGRVVLSTVGGPHDPPGSPPVESPLTGSAAPPTR